MITLAVIILSVLSSSLSTDIVCNDEWTKERMIVEDGESINLILLHNTTVQDSVGCKAAFLVSSDSDLWS